MAFGMFGALSGGVPGVFAGRKAYDEDQTRQAEQQLQKWDMMGMAALGRAFQPDQGPQPPMPGQPSVPNAPPPGGPAQPPMGGPPQAPPMAGPPQPPPGGGGGSMFGGMPGWAPGERPIAMGEPPGGGAGPPPSPPGLGQSGAPPPGPIASPPGQPAGGGMPQLDLQTLTQRIQSRSPDLPPQAMMAALKRAEPLLNAQSKMQLAQEAQQFRQSELQEKQRHNRALEQYYGLAGGAPGQRGGGADQRTAEDTGLPPGASPTQAGPYDYSRGAPSIDKGMDIPEPQPVSGYSSQNVKQTAETYLQTGKLPPLGSARGAELTRVRDLRNSITNYATAMARSRGISEADLTWMQRTAPGALRFVMGPDGRATVALGTTVRHLDTVQELANAWNPSNTQAFNRLAKLWATQTGAPEPTNLQSAAQIVGAEIIKALGVAGAGTKEERDAAANAFSAIQSPAQLKGAIETVQKLLAGQLEGRRRQAATVGLPEDRFKSLIGDRPYQILSGLEKKGGPSGAPSAATGFDRDAAKKAGYTDEEIDKFLKGK